MNKTQLIKELTELFHLFKYINDPARPKNVEFPVVEMAFHRPAAIYRHFGLEPSVELDDIIDGFLAQDDLTAETLEQVIGRLSQTAAEELSKPVFSVPERSGYEEAITEADDISLSEDLVPEMREFVMKNILVPLSDAEFTHIEVGFRLMWNHSTGKIIADGDFERWVSQYLISIEFHVEQRKVTKVIDLILEYMEEIGQWQ